MGMLPEGLSFVRAEREPVWVDIIQSDLTKPKFRVKVGQLSVDRFKRLLSKSTLPAGVRPNSKAAEQHAHQFNVKYCKTVVLGWEGLTVENLEAILAGDDVLAGDALEEWRESGREMQHSNELAVYLHENTWAENYSNKIFEALQAGAEVDGEIEEESFE